jgi:hypothetical protein
MNPGSQSKEEGKLIWEREKIKNVLREDYSCRHLQLILLSETLKYFVDEGSEMSH